MVRAEYEHIQDGTVFRTVAVRSDLRIDVDADGYVLGVERVGDDVRQGDLEDVLRCCVYPLEEEIR